MASESTYSVFNKEGAKVKSIKGTRIELKDGHCKIYSGPANVIAIIPLGSFFVAADP